jgi:hypothetical protein
MGRRRLYSLVAGLTIVVTLGLILTFVVVPGISKNANSLVSSPMVASAPDSPAEGISVHGHWTIEVKNPDGTLAERREFDNALATDGSATLSMILARQKSITGWSIGLGGTLSPFLNDSGAQQQGSIVDSTWSTPDRSYFRTLTVNVPTSGENMNRLVLSGTATAHQDGTITDVRTKLWIQPIGGPAGSYLGLGPDFTHYRLTSAVNLTAGQTVTVTVVMRFS